MREKQFVCKTNKLNPRVIKKKKKIKPQNLRLLQNKLYKFINVKSYLDF